MEERLADYGDHTLVVPLSREPSRTNIHHAHAATVKAAYRRRGFGTALTAAHLHDALNRGCRTASLQSAAMAENVYAAAGFEDLGRIIEYLPPVIPLRPPP